VSETPSPETPPVLSRDQVAHVAKLARLELSDQELEMFTGQLASVLAHAADVAALDLRDVEPSAHPLDLRNVLREDEPVPSLPRQDVLAAAPAVEEERFLVPRIIGDAP
jgi:aspartyl-tRNA(Asn)/glutamyl-tRNA(Gln) amidotransferase subunit C